METPTCPACLAPIRDGARFCGKCGMSFTGEVPRIDPPRQVRPLLQVLAPALWLWVLLALSNLLLGLYLHFTKVSSPLYTALMLGFDALIILAFVAAKSPASWRLMAPAGVTPRLLVEILGLPLVLFAFMKLYGWFLSSMGLTFVEYLADFREYGWPLWSAFLLIAVWPALFEELAFRGLIFEKLRDVGGPREALILQALLFSILHLMPAAFISHFLIGLVLGWLRIRYQSLVPSMAVHLLYNSAILVDELLRQG